MKQKNDYFWLITGIETTLIGLALALVFFVFDERLPSVFLQIQMPYISFLMILAGIAIALSFRQSRLWVLIVAGAVWAYLMISFIMEMFSSDSPFVVIPILFSILSAGLLTRIVIRAWTFSPTTSKKKRKGKTNEN